ncbi:iron-sulfur cluster insertion protein ErpA [Candidatus Woesebacteria bacterium]|nr:iron-sulfur cluster insertion protein ErpA [Candidatus Woesebacteria bacterium]
MITLSTTAAEKVTALLVERPSQAGLRVGVRGGGCSGFTYFLEFEDKIDAKDRELESHGVKIIVDSKSYLYLMGIEIDYLDNLNGAGFKFNNPNAKRTCGCGESFSI